MHEPERGTGEEVRHLPAARHAQAVADVGRRLLGGERPQVPAQRDALIQLRERGIEKQLGQLRLSHQDEAQELLGVGLEVREEAELLEDLDRDRLRLVDDDDRQASRLALGQEVHVERVGQGGLRATRGRHPELPDDALEELLGRQRRIEDVGDRHVGPEPFEERPQEGRLAGADVAGDADEATRLGEPQTEVCERLAVLGGEEEVARVGRQPKRRVDQPEEPFIHRSASPRSCSIDL